MARQLSMTRNAIRKRLTRRGFQTTGLGYETLVELDAQYRNLPTTEQQWQIITAEPTNFDQLKNILAHFAEVYEDYFVGTWRNAWRYLKEIKSFYLLLDEEKVNNDQNFQAREIVVNYNPPSSYEIDNEPDLDPRDIIQYLRILYDDYLR